MEGATTEIGPLSLFDIKEACQSPPACDFTQQLAPNAWAWNAHANVLVVDQARVSDEAIIALTIAKYADHDPCSTHRADFFRAKNQRCFFVYLLKIKVIIFVSAPISAFL